MNYLDSLQNSGSSFQREMILLNWDFEKNSPRSPVTLDGDRKQLLQVMMHLCDITKTSDLKWLFWLLLPSKFRCQGLSISG